MTPYAAFHPGDSIVTVRLRDVNMNIGPTAQIVVRVNTPKPKPTPCRGDCNSDRHVTVDEVLTMMNIALGNSPTSDCIWGDGNHDGTITVDEILAAVSNALNGCP